MTIRPLAPLFAAGLLAGTLSAALAPPARAQSLNVVELAQSAPTLSILVEAVGRVGLADALVAGNYTVFAPTNDAFVALLDELGLTSLDDVPDETLTEILFDHVVPGQFGDRFLATLDEDDQTLTALGGLTLEFDADPLEVNDIPILIGGLLASNAVVHVIDDVLLDPDPRPSITEIAVATPDLSILVEAVVRTGLDGVLMDAGPLTVFAPTNAAFGRLLAALGLTSLDDVDGATLVAILLDHVITGEHDRDELRGTKAIGGKRLFFSRTSVNRIPFVGDQAEAYNGTVHIIDGVLIE